MSVDFVKIILQIYNYKSLPTLTLRNDEWNHEFFFQPHSNLLKYNDLVVDVKQLFLLIASYLLIGRSILWMY